MSDSLPFDGPASESVAESLRLATTTQLGHEMARRVEQHCEMARAAREMSDQTDDLITAAGAAAQADWAAGQASDYSSCVLALVGNGDSALTTKALGLARTARTHAATAQRNWLRLKGAQRVVGNA